MKVRNKLFLLIVMIVGIIILLTHLFNDLYLEEYYFNIKKEQLLEVAESIRDQGTAFDLERFEEENKTLIDFIPFEFIERGGMDIPAYAGEEVLSLKDEPGRVIYLRVRGEFFNVEKLMLLTAFDRRRLLTVSTPVSSIREPLEIITAYHMNIILMAALLGLIISWVISVLITKPLVRIEEIAHRVADLDFTEKFQGSSSDEVGRLGRSINKMSGYLEENIRELSGTRDQLEEANRSLIKEIEKEKKIEEMRREFISNVSHELKTPIAVISNYTEGIIEGIASDDKTRDFYLDVIHQEARSMNSLVKSLLLLSKLEGGYSTLNLGEVSLKEMVEREAQKILPLIEKKQIELKSSLEDLTFAGDPEKLSMVVRNLMSNSLKYTPEGGKILIRSEEKNGRYRFEIYNTASVSDETIEKIWIPFYRGDKARNREEGTGLGLAIVKEVLELHGYDFGAERHRDGIRFWFEEEKS